MTALQTLRTARDNDRVHHLLTQIEQAAREPQTLLMPLLVEAVESYATTGEICDALRRVFGEYTPESWV
jgi:methylmalonyl-CoA mutase N-terminal domain/subunit